MSPPPDLTKARYFAELCHAGQSYNDEVPYTVHLDAAVTVLKRFGIHDPVMLCAGFLHDVIEDTGRSYGEIKKRFGEAVAELVYAVTNELGRNRRERAYKTYPKLRASCEARILKLADRIANVEYGAANEGGKNDMYRDEFDDFYKAVYPHDAVVVDSVERRMWEHLARLLGKELS